MPVPPLLVKVETIESIIVSAEGNLIYGQGNERWTYTLPGKEAQVGKAYLS